MGAATLSAMNSPCPVTQRVVGPEIGQVTSENSILSGLALVHRSAPIITNVMSNKIEKTSGTCIGVTLPQHRGRQPPQQLAGHLHGHRTIYCPPFALLCLSPMLINPDMQPGINFIVKFGHQVNWGNLATSSSPVCQVFISQPTS